MSPSQRPQRTRSHRRWLGGPRVLGTWPLARSPRRAPPRPSPRQRHRHRSARWAQRRRCPAARPHRTAAAAAWSRPRPRGRPPAAPSRWPALSARRRSAAAEHRRGPALGAAGPTLPWSLVRTPWLRQSALTGLLASSCPPPRTQTCPRPWTPLVGQEGCESRRPACVNQGGPASPPPARGPSSRGRKTLPRAGQSLQPPLLRMLKTSCCAASRPWVVAAAARRRRCVLGRSGWLGSVAEPGPAALRPEPRLLGPRPRLEAAAAPAPQVPAPWPSAASS
mmetsp:Transcript_66990/g.185530  ORF Transcript_66990/g.185530 Transcript_66990/m.185530 type:complete len:279 (+) Transcript_66990:1557-2393(+)